MRRRVALWSSFCVCCLAVLTACSSPEQREANYLKRGIEYFKQGAYREAGIEFANAAKIKPTDAVARYNIGLVYEALGDNLNAFNAFNAAEEQDPHYVPCLIKLAEIYLAAGKIEDGSRRVDTLLADDPQSANGHALRASQLLRQDDKPGAESEARAALRREPGNLLATAVLTGLYASLGDEKQTEAVLDAALALHPRTLSLRNLEIAAYDRLGDLPKLQAAYDAVFQLVAPPAREQRVQLAMRLAKSGDAPGAERVLRAGVQAAGGDQPMEFALIQFLNQYEGLDAAKAEIEAIRRADPANDDYGLWLADLLWKRGDAAAAASDLSAAVEQAHGPAQKVEAETLLARVEASLGHRDHAEALVTAALTGHPGDRSALYVRASLAYDRGAYLDAVSDLRTVTREAPDDEEASELLAETVLRQGHPDLAIDTLGHVLQLDPQKLAALVRMAQMYYLIGDSGRAFELLRAATQIDPSYPVAWESLARIAEDVRDWPRAADALEHLQVLDGQRQVALVLRGHLLDGEGKTDEAYKIFVTAIEAGPQSPAVEVVLDLLIESARRNGRLAEAEAMIDKLPVEPGLKSDAIGRCELELGHDDAAASALDRAISARVPRADAYLARAGLAVRARQADKALQILKLGGDLLPTDTAIPMMEADILRATDRMRDAIPIYAAILARNPALDKAANNFASLVADYDYRDPALLGRARQLAERFRASDDASFLDTLGWVYFREDMIAESISVFDRATRLGDLSPIQHYHYGAALLRSGRPDDARRELTAALAAQQGFPGREDAVRMLAGI
jgi:tetratricopeptide (TPR) repeat protein